MYVKDEAVTAMIQAMKDQATEKEARAEGILSALKNAGASNLYGAQEQALLAAALMGQAAALLGVAKVLEEKLVNAEEFDDFGR